jgi:hypothetical protein
MELRILRQKMDQAEIDLAAANVQCRHLNQARTFFKGAETFPVMQTNGQMVEFHQVLMMWTSKTDDEGHNPHRTYTCPISSSYTSLCPFPVLHQIQGLATSMGLRLEPPLAFERRVNDEWTLLSARTQIQLSARVCFLYANRKRFEKNVETSTTMTEDEQLIVTFRVEKRKVSRIYSVFSKRHQNTKTPSPSRAQDGDTTPPSNTYTLHFKGIHQNGSDQTIRMRITRPGWTPFAGMSVESAAPQTAAGTPASPPAST